MSRKRRLVSLGELSGELVQKMDPQGLRHNARVVAAWPAVAGAEVAGHTRGLSLRSGELVVFVDSPAWANELTFMSEDFCRLLNEEAGKELVKRIRFVVSKRARETDVFPERVEPEPTGDETLCEPLSEAEKTQIRRAAASIDDAALREAAVRAMTGDLERRESRDRRSRTSVHKDSKDTV